MNDLRPKVHIRPTKSGDVWVDLAVAGQLITLAKTDSTRNAECVVRTLDLDPTLGYRLAREMQISPTLEVTIKCSHCQDFLPPTSRYFGARENKSWGLESQCRSCANYNTELAKERAKERKKHEAV